MKQDVLITIRGIQTVEDEKDSTELFTVGNLYLKNNKWYLLYQETETTGFEGCTTTLKIDGERAVTMTRSGQIRSQLILELGKRNIGYYELPEGNLMIGVTAREIRSSLSPQGGQLYCRYDLDVNSAVISKNELYVDVALPQ